VLTGPKVAVHGHHLSVAVAGDGDVGVWCAAVEQPSEDHREAPAVLAPGPPNQRPQLCHQRRRQFSFMADLDQDAGVVRALNRLPQVAESAAPSA
jgi:hypothetical protein